ncbi:hypothetical protein DACRYDRAFT_17883 [Dacryopinax primogenitus]|uniref:Uncharacterized protein n=1 Tax=Dacryopinax primogenitus (strain DJM 731) TaxID=1858805 RepID=M5FPQ1_DACPD|nr:uncharacterized protein DACRYDRAFT_17883 [Dacryopinax primogenitus]EJT98700.1 hypothetical protein DACRYDRAFT_17883 [Dacryopinax primogenitus]
MGQALAAAREAVLAGDKQNKQELEEQLSFLVRLATAKLDKYQADLEAVFMTDDPRNSHRGGIPGFRALRWERAYDVDISKDSNETLVTGALDVFLGNGHAGEHEEQKFFIFMQHNAIIRIDVKIWRYNFVSKGVMGEKENTDGGADIFCTSVVNHDVLQDDELLYLLSEYAGDNAMADYLAKLVGMWNLIKSVTAEAKDPKNRLRIMSAPAPKAIEAAPTAAATKAEPDEKDVPTAK